MKEKKKEKEKEIENRDFSLAASLAALCPSRKINLFMHMYMSGCLQVIQAGVGTSRFTAAIPYPQ